MLTLKLVRIFCGWFCDSLYLDDQLMELAAHQQPEEQVL
jgi:hypothetical protein